MKTTNRILLAVSLFASPVLFAAGGGSGQSGAYEQAVEDYIVGATRQMQAIRVETDAAAAKAGEGARQTYAEIYRGLDECGAMLAQLRVAVPRDFDHVKARFEVTRQRVIAALEAARKALPATPAAKG